jgi:hypothetical protein
MDHASVERVVFEALVAETGRCLFESAMIGPQEDGGDPKTRFERAWGELEGSERADELRKIKILSEGKEWEVRIAGDEAVNLTKVNSKKEDAKVAVSTSASGKGVKVGSVTCKELYDTQSKPSTGTDKAKMGGLGGLFGSRQRSFTHTGEDDDSEAKAAAAVSSVRS